jgi:probable FeS assembly SUF system protein SufT
MHHYETVTLSREVDAVRIPSGEKGFIPAGTEVTITQVLGGSFTVQFDGGLARIEAKDADALGKQVAAPTPPASTPAGVPAGPRTREQIDKEVQAALRTCYDPEIPVNIADLGLIYNCELTELGAESYKVDVKMTLTAPGCGMGPVLVQDVQNKLLCLEGVDDVAVELVWDPPWNQGLMTEAARLQLGLM